MAETLQHGVDETSVALVAQADHAGHPVAGEDLGRLVRLLIVAVDVRRRAGHVRVVLGTQVPALVLLHAQVGHLLQHLAEHLVPRRRLAQHGQLEPGRVVRHVARRLRVLAAAAAGAYEVAFQRERPLQLGRLRRLAATTAAAAGVLVARHVQRRVGRRAFLQQRYLVHGDGGGDRRGDGGDDETLRPPTGGFGNI